MKRLFITDLDGTLLNDNAELTDETIKILNSIIDKGADFTVATARTFATVLEMFENVWLRLPIVLMNGVMIYDPIKKQVIKSCEIKNETAKTILQIYQNHGRAPMMYYDKGDHLEIRYADLANAHQQAYINKRTKVEGKTFSYSSSLAPSDNEKLVYIVTLDKYDNLIGIYNEVKNFKDVTVAFYSDNYTDCYFLEIFSKDASKAIAATEIKEMISADKIVSFGDNLNDISMFEISDEAYAVGNACEELKAIATDIIGTNNENSVAKKIKYIFDSDGDFNG